MSNLPRIAELLDRGEQVYMKDDFYEVAIRIETPMVTWLKHRDHAEVLVPHGYDTACQIELGGEFITKEEYENY